MNKKNNHEDAIIVRLSAAKPSDSSPDRVEQLLQLSKTKHAKTSRGPMSLRVKASLIAAPVIASILALQFQSLTTSSPELILRIQTSNSQGTNQHAQMGTSSAAACHFGALRCNDMGPLLGEKVNWNYTTAFDITNNATEGTVHGLSSSGRELELAGILKKEFNLNEPVRAAKENDSFVRYVAGSDTGRHVFAGTSLYGTQIAYNNPESDNWSLCQVSKPRNLDCDSITFETMPSNSEVLEYSKALLEKLGINSGSSLPELSDGDYFSVAKEFDYGRVVISNLVLGGEKTPWAIEMHWSTGSSKVSMFFGTIFSIQEFGLYKTLNAEQSIKRLTELNAYPSGEPPLKYSEKSIIGMPYSEQLRLQQKKENGDSGPIKINVKVTRAEATQVTIFDVNGKTWVVPGYSYFDETGYLGSAPSIDDSYIEIVPRGK